MSVLRNSKLLSRKIAMELELKFRSRRDYTSIGRYCGSLDETGIAFSVNLIIGTVWFPATCIFICKSVLFLINQIR